MANSGFRITKEQVGVVISWLGYIEQTRVALELEATPGHEAFCQTLEKASGAIFRVLSDLQPA
jgi:hypothetical protein